MMRIDQFKGSAEVVILFVLISNASAGATKCRDLQELMSDTKNGTPLLRRLVYDDSHITRFLDDRLAFLKNIDSNTGELLGYLPLRDYFNLSDVFWPSEEKFEQKNLEEILYSELRAIDIVSGIMLTDDIWQYSDRRELEESGGDEVDALRCRDDLLFLKKELDKSRNDSNYLYTSGKNKIEILRWIDTWGRPPSETNWGSSFWVGSYRACKLSQISRGESNEGETIKFNYCWAKLLAKDWPDKDELVPRVTLRSGICLPSSCDTLLARREKRLLIELMEFNFSPLQKERFLNKSIYDIYCLPIKLPDVQPGEQLSVAAKSFLYFTTAWISMIALCSVLKWYLADQKWIATSRLFGFRRSGSNFREFIERMSVQRSWMDLVDDGGNSAKDGVDLRSIGIVKLVSCFLVTIAHCVENMYWYFYSSTIHLYESRKLHYLSLSWFTKSVDMFFVTSGILVGYSLLRKYPKERLHEIVKPRNYLLIIVTRYLRLAPLMIYAFAFKKALFIYLSEGPFWDYATYATSHEGLCRHSSWWRQLIWPIIIDIGATNGDPHESECLTSSWYLITDLKMFLVLPLYFYYLFSRKTLRLTILSYTILIATLWNYLHLSMQNLIYFRQYFDYGLMHTSSIMIGYFETSYFSAISRFSSLAMGLYGGIHLFRYRNGKIKQWPFFMRAPFIWLLISWQFYDLFVRAIWAEVHYRQTGQVVSEETFKWLTLLKQRLDTITIVIFTLRLATDCSAGLMRNATLCFKLSKLSYCVYTIHSILISYAITANQHSRPDSEPLQVLMFCVFILVTSFLIALPVYLFIESPSKELLNFTLNKITGHRKLDPGLSKAGGVEKDINLFDEPDRAATQSEERPRQYDKKSE